MPGQILREYVVLCHGFVPHSRSAFAGDLPGDAAEMGLLMYWDDVNFHHFSNLCDSLVNQWVLLDSGGARG